MKVHLIASVYMKDDDIPCLIVSCKKFDELVKNPELIEPEFYATWPTAKECHDNINKAFGLKIKDNKNETDHGI